MTSSVLLNNLLALGVDFILWLQSFRSPALTEIFHYFTWAADFRIFLVIIPLIWWSRGAAAGLQLSATAIVSSVLNTLIKDAVALPRPFQVFPDVIQLSQASGYSFPSGHAQFGAAIWTSLFLLYPKPIMFIVSSTVIVFSGLSRSYFGVHYPTDVIAGWALGLSVTYELTKITLARAGEARLNFKIRVLAAGATIVIVAIYPHPHMATSMGASAGIALGASAWTFAGFQIRWQPLALGALGLLVLIGLNMGFSPWILSWSGGDKVPLSYLFTTFALYAFYVASFPHWYSIWQQRLSGTTSV